MRNDLQRALPPNMKMQALYTGTKLSSQFSNIKNVTPLEEQQDLA